MLSPWLVSKDLEVFEVRNRAKLDDIITDKKIDRKNKAPNLRQLMGYDSVTTAGENSRSGRFEADSWQLYYSGVGSAKSVQCIQQDGSDL